MSKYIIELNEDCKIVQQMCVTERGNAYTNGCYSCDLEELNSDYINEHYGELQDEAYQKGFEDGKKSGYEKGLNAVGTYRKGHAIGYDEGYEDGKNSYDKNKTYQRGLEDGKWKAEDGCDGCKYYEDTSLTNPCSECSRGHVDRYKPVSEPDRIEVGDIVDRYIDGKFDSRGIYLGGNGEIWDCLFWANTLPITLAYPKGQFKKTGKHYDIASILEAMRTHD